MNTIPTKYTQVLELEKVLALVSNEAVLSDTKELAVNIIPDTDINSVKKLQQLTLDAYKLLLKYGAPRFSGARNSANALARANVGGVLSPKELLDIADTLRSIRIVKDWKSNNASEETTLDDYFSTLMPNKFLEEKIFFCIKSEEEISDSASVALSEIRRKIRAESSNVRQKLDEVVRSRAKYLQDALVTQRDGRFVVPVKAEHRSSVPGLVHDTSASGATLFVEPMAVVESNNELKILAAKEKEEIARILAELSALVAEFADTVNRSYKALCQLDLFFAKANFAVKTRAMSPSLNQTGYIHLKNARHPLLNPKTVVPVTVTLGKDYDTLVITGPNTGGKTVTLKTVGLFCLMAMCGLMIPADDSSEVCVFNKILVDIGDEQSIEQSLSTFSSHMVRIIEIVEQTDTSTLALIDELGAGTDPVEGAALAKAILINLAQRGARIVATTHYAELKSYAIETDRVENAGCEFDVETLKPTYRLIVGTPGRSNAFAISTRLGLCDEIVRSAKEFVSEESLSFERVLESLEIMRKDAENAKKDAEALRIKYQESNRKASTKLAEVEKNAAKAIEKARKDAMDIVDRARVESTKLIEELEVLRKNARNDNAEEMLRRARQTAKGSLDKMSSEADPVLKRSNKGYKLPRPIAVGDRVLIVDIDKQGDVIAVSKDNGRVQVVAGIFKTWVEVDNLRLVEYDKVSIPKERRVTGVASKVERNTTGEVDIRGMAADEGLLELDKYIDEAVLSRLSSIVIIHGKGTGVLKKAVRSYLKTHRSIRTFRPGVFGEGEDGVTVAELK